MEVDFLEPLDYEKVQQERAQIAAVRNSPAFTGVRGATPSPLVRAIATPIPGSSSPSIASVPMLNIGEAMSGLSVGENSEDNTKSNGEKSFLTGGQVLGSASDSNAGTPGKCMRSVLAEAAMRRMASAKSSSANNTSSEIIDTNETRVAEMTTSPRVSENTGTSTTCATPSKHSDLGGKVFSNTTPTPIRSRTLNKFEAARAAKAFQGSGKTLHD